MSNYKMEIYCVKTTDGLQWNVEFPEVPGCGGAGDTIEEAMEDAQINLNVHLDYLKENGIAVPVPDTSFHILEYSGKLSLRIPKSLHRQIAENAQKDDVSINSYINNALSDYVGQVKALESVKKEAVESIQQASFNTMLTNYLTGTAGENWHTNSETTNLIFSTMEG